MGSSSCQYIKMNLCIRINEQIINDNKNDVITSSQDISPKNKNIINLQKLNISEPSIPIIKEEGEYKIIILQNNEKKVLIKLYNIFNNIKYFNNKKEVLITYNNGEKYIGEWDSLNNHKEGRGIKIFHNNHIYYGYWENDKMNGKGKLIKFKNKIKDLDIIFNDDESPYFFGTWKDNLQDGYGKETWEDNSFYEGEYKKGYKEGRGKLILPDETEYEGEFYHGQIHGKGKIKYNDGRSYEGSWNLNKMHGYGKFDWPDGRSYKGNYQNNLKSGYGEFTWPNGRIYKGMWEKGKQNGNGKLYIPESNIWINGIWKDGKRIKK